jgi:hypothetical protein
MLRGGISFYGGVGMGGKHIKLTGVKQLQRKLGRVAAMKSLQRELLKGASRVKIKTEEYAPESEANTPKSTTPGAKWYERGYGQRWANEGARGGRAKRTSQTLGKRWYMRPLSGIGAVIGNTASYAKYVHGKLQARFHKARGWLKLEDVAEDELPKITKSLQDAINRELRR